MIIPESLVLNITSNSTGSNNCWTVTAFDDDIFEETIEMFTLELMVVDNSDTTFTEGLKTAVFNITDNDSKVKLLIKSYHLHVYTFQMPQFHLLRRPSQQTRVIQALNCVSGWLVLLGEQREALW